MYIILASFPIGVCWLEGPLVANEGSKLVQIITDLVVFIGCSFQMTHKLVIGYDIFQFTIANTNHEVEFLDSFFICLLNILTTFLVTFALLEGGEPAMGRGTSPIHDGVGPGPDGSIPPFSRVSILTVWLRLPITDVVGPENVLDIVGDLILAESLICLSIALHLHVLSPKVWRNCLPCRKHPSPSSNVHFRSTTKIAAHGLALNFCYLLLLSLFSNYELFMYFCFWSFFHSYGSFNHVNFNILELL